MPAIDVPGFVADLKAHAADHGFHLHDERHFVETYSLRQAWEVDLHPEEACGGPLDLHLALQLDPRILLGFEEAVMMLDDEAEPERWREDRRHCRATSRPRSPGLREQGDSGVLGQAVVMAGWRTASGCTACRVSQPPERLRASIPSPRRMRVAR